MTLTNPNELIALLAGTPKLRAIPSLGHYYSKTIQTNTGGCSSCSRGIQQGERSAFESVMGNLTEAERFEFKRVLSTAQVCYFRQTSAGMIKYCF